MRTRQCNKDSTKRKNTDNGLGLNSDSSSEYDPLSDTSDPEDDSDPSDPEEDSSMEEDDLFKDELSSILALGILSAMMQKNTDGDSEHKTSNRNSKSKKTNKRRKIIANPMKNNKRIRYVQPPYIPSSLDELIALGTQLKNDRKQYRDCSGLSSILPALIELQQLHGMTVLKTQVTKYVLTQMQHSGLESNMQHLIISGSPGCGKTTVATIIGKIIGRLRYNTEKENIVYGTQGNMIAGYLGQTATKTEKLIRSAFGGVLIIDEASSLADGRSAEGDSFSKSCIDTLNRMLTENGEKFVCILAGYKKEILRDIISINPGMSRRFGHFFTIDTYTPLDLYAITMSKLEQTHLTIIPTQQVLNIGWFKDHLRLFPNYGGDCQRLVDMIKTNHAVNCFGKVDKKTVTLSSMQAGIHEFTTLFKTNCPDRDMSTLAMYT